MLSTTRFIRTCSIPSIVRALRNNQFYLSNNVSFPRNFVSVVSNRIAVNGINNIVQHRSVSFSFKNRLPDDLGGLQIKKRPIRKKRTEELDKNGHFNVTAYATAEEYDLERLHSSLIKQELYQAKQFATIDGVDDDQSDVLYVTAKYKIGEEPREVFFFREGSVVMWNCPEMECSNILAHLKNFEIQSYSSALVQDESDTMSYNYNDTKATMKNGNFYVTKNSDAPLEKYTFSNAMITSVKLGIWEASLDKYVDSMAYVTEDLKRGNKIKMTRSEMLRKTGELFALRHLINLSSDLLDTPDFYWDRDELEKLYLQTCGYFSIQRRTKVMNEKLNHCVELADLVSSNLNDKHHIRLEWMIIVLIMVEVAFECLHYAERYLTKHQENHIQLLDSR